MRRDQRKGTPQAKVRMAELRHRKAHLAVVEASRAWCARHGVPYDTNWLAAAKAAGYPHATGLTAKQKQHWFETN